MGTSSLLKIGSRGFFGMRTGEKPLRALLSSMNIAPIEKFRKDFKPLPWTLTSVHLDFKLRDTTWVSAKLAINFPNDSREDLVLDCEDVDVRSVKIDGREIAQFRLQDGKLTIDAQALPINDQFESETVTALQPASNLQLSGLYQSSGAFCTQCEAEGFRRITPFPDRPDVMTKFTVRLEAERTKYPVLLSNGNLVQSGETDTAGSHFVVWEDPFKKPSYLFALVGGDLASITDSFTTASNRQVHLEIFSEHGNEDQLGHAMRSLKRAMRWDEDSGCDGDKGLNIFNTALTLAKQSTATDGDFERIESVIGHEYFHNWSGNRVTCQDWFQLTLKEGFTVYRDQEFSKDMGDAQVCRINEVRSLRARQFPEDAGPMAHPIRPESYIAMDNFYTSTVYEKGAEVIRMYETLLGRAGFRQGSDLYFKRHDGQAVTCDDFRAAFSDATERDLTQFERWYTQPGTPTITVSDQTYDHVDGTFTFTLSQSCRASPSGVRAEPFHVPFLVGLLDKRSGAQVLDTTLVELTKTTQRFTVPVPCPVDAVVPSFLRNFSAPVKLQVEPPLQAIDLAFLMQHDTDAYNRWDAAQTLFMNALQHTYSSGDIEQALKPVVQAMKAVMSLSCENKDGRFLAAVMLTVPSLNEICQALPPPVNPVLAAQIRRRVKKRLAEAVQLELEACLEATRPTKEFSIIPDEQGRRALHNLCLDYLALTEHGAGLALAHYEQATCMTDKLGALVALAPLDAPQSRVALDAFEVDALDALVMDKWFSVQAAVCSVAQIQYLLSHKDFSWVNPNRIRSVLSIFSSANLDGFHTAEGYQLVGDAVIKLDMTNPQVSARLAQSFSSLHRYDEGRQELMRAQLTRFVTQEGVSKELFEIASKSLKTVTK